MHQNVTSGYLQVIAIHNEVSFLRFIYPYLTIFLFLSKIENIKIMNSKLLFLCDKKEQLFVCVQYILILLLYNIKRVHLRTDTKPLAIRFVTRGR